MTARLNGCRLTCDHPGCREYVETFTGDHRLARREARHQGWIFDPTSGGDYCPNHTEAT